MRLAEARQIVAEAQRFKRETGHKYADFGAVLKARVNDGLFMHFTPKSKVGVNTKSKWTTVPAGVYTYPLNRTTLNDLFSGTREVLSNYALAFSNVYLLKITSGRVITLTASKQGYTEADYASDKLRLRMNAEDSAWAATMQGNQSEHPFTRLLSLTFHLAKKKVGTWTKILVRKLGITAIVDNGSGLLDDREPTQAVLLDRRGFKVVGAGKNPRGALKSMKAVFTSFVRRMSKGLRMAPTSKETREPDLWAGFLVPDGRGAKQFAAKHGWTPRMRIFVSAGIATSGYGSRARNFRAKLSVYTQTPYGIMDRDNRGLGSWEPGKNTSTWNPDTTVLLAVTADEGKTQAPAKVLRDAIKAQTGSLLKKLHKNMAAFDAALVAGAKLG